MQGLLGKRGVDWMSDQWMDLVPIKWFSSISSNHTISAHPFCQECDLYGEKQWRCDPEYPTVLIDAPWPAFPDKERWIWMCESCFYGVVLVEVDVDDPSEDYCRAVEEEE